MSKPQRTVVDLIASVTGDGTFAMKKARYLTAWGGTGIEAGGRIVLGTGTTGKFQITDANGKVLYSNAAAVTTNTDIAPIPAGILGPITIVATATDGTFTIYWSVKR